MPHTSMVRTLWHKPVVGRGFRKRGSVNAAGTAPLRRDQRSCLGALRCFHVDAQQRRLPFLGSPPVHPQTLPP